MVMKRILKDILSKSFNSPVEVIFHDGEKYAINGDTPKYKLVFHKNISKKLLDKDPILAFAEAYIDGSVDIKGDKVKLIHELYCNEDSFLSEKGRILKKMVSLLNNKKASEENVHFHYDIGNDFYRLWLDETMTYSCAYFAEENESLKDAQLGKVDHVLKKLCISPGDRLLDIGCGWGELILRAARDYGAQCYGITLSQEQFNRVQERIAEHGLEGQVKVLMLDYRELQDLQFERIVSIGMLEHVGKNNLNDYFSTVQALLVDGGLCLTHSITAPNEGGNNAFINKYIFPGGYIPGIKEIVTYIAENHFHLIDIESLRRHYARTLRIWHENFVDNLDKIREDKSDAFIRTWELYLNGSEASFTSGHIDVHQFLFSKGTADYLPMTRSYMY